MSICMGGHLGAKRRIGGWRTGRWDSKYVENVVLKATALLLELRNLAMSPKNSSVRYHARICFFTDR